MTEKKVRLRCVAGAACIALALTGYGAWRLDALDAQGTHDVQAPDGNVEHAGDRLPVVFVQGNIDQNQKWDRAFIDSTLEIYTGLSPAWSPESQERRPLVIWPETAMPFDYLSSGFGKDIRSFAAQNNIWLLFGAPGVIRDTRGESLLLNRAYLLGPDGRNYGTYEKEHLVPFGEFVPPWLNIPFLEPLLQGIGDFMPGTAVKPLVLADALIPDLIPEEEGALSARAGTARLALGILICYETIFPELSRQRVADGAEVLINISNDAWFGRSSAPEQHLQLSALGAVEQKRFIARGTNTGISAIIDPAGRILFRSELFVTGAFAGSVTPRMDKTVFYHMFPWLVPAALAGFILLVPRPFRRRNIHT